MKYRGDLKNYVVVRERLIVIVIWNKLVLVRQIQE